MEDSERERLEALLDAITLAGNAEQVREEIGELRSFADSARAVRKFRCRGKVEQIARNPAKARILR